MKDGLLLLQLFKNQPITDCKFFRWLTFADERILILILSKMCFPTSPIFNIARNIYVFHEVKPIYKQALNNSDFNTTLVFENNNTRSKNNTESQNTGERYYLA